MSLRPRDPNLARVARAGQRMAPGGRRWSEAPIPRVGRRRVRAVGVPNTTPPTYVATSDGSLNSGGATTYTIPTTSLTSGDVIVAIALVNAAATITPPTGWTTLVSGDVGDMTYWAGWIRLAGSDDTTITRSTATSLMRIRSWRWTDAASGSFTATAAVEDTAVSSEPVVVPDGAWMIPFQVQMWISTTTPNYREWIKTGDPTGTGDLWGAMSGYGDIYLWHSLPNDQVDPEGPHSGTHYNYSDSGRTTPKTIDVITSFAIGWE